MSVGVMKDYKLKQRDLRSHTLCRLGGNTELGCLIAADKKKGESPRIKHVTLKLC